MPPMTIAANGNDAAGVKHSQSFPADQVANGKKTKGKIGISETLSPPSRREPQMSYFLTGVSATGVTGLPCSNQETRF
jgi:hypothetical protein